MGKVCNVNKLDAASAETMLRTAFAVLLDAVNKMVGPDGSYLVPIWDQITPLFSGGYNFTRTMRDDEECARLLQLFSDADANTGVQVFPEIVTPPLQIREHEIAIESAFG